MKPEKSSKKGTSSGLQRKSKFSDSLSFLSVKSFSTKLVKFLVVWGIINLLYMSQFLWMLVLVAILCLCSVLLCFTSFLWFPLFLIWGPSVILLALMLNHSGIGEMFIDYSIRTAKIFLSRRSISYLTYECLFWLCHLGANDDQALESVTSTNLGYAWITESGDVPKNFIKMPDQLNCRQY